MGLRDSLEAIIAHAQDVQTHNNCENKELLQIYEGNLKEFVEDAMLKEFKGSTFERAKHRIAPINIFKRLVDKLAKVYTQGVIRTSQNTTDQQLINDYELMLDLDNQMGWSDTVFNAIRSCAFEPYLDDEGFPRLRILAPHQFTVWSDNRVDPTQETVFIKFFGTADSVDGVNDNDEDCISVNIYALYNDMEFMIVDSQLNERPDLLPESPNDADDKTPEERGLHGFGRIPFIYQKSTRTQLVPDPNIDDKAMAILIPILLTDLNYASKYLSYGIKYGIDIDGSNLEGNPDSMWIVNSKEGDNKKPQIGILAPAVEISEVLKLIGNTISMWLESKSIKSGTTGEAEMSISGIAKLIDNADVTDVRKENAIIFKATEEMGLWPLLGVMHNRWADDDLLNDKVNTSRFSDDFMININFGDMTPVTDPREKREDLKFRIDNKLTTLERAIREANPDMEVEEQDKLIAEIKAENRPSKTDLINVQNKELNNE